MGLMPSTIPWKPKYGVHAFHHTLKTKVWGSCLQPYPENQNMGFMPSTIPWKPKYGAHAFHPTLKTKIWGSSFNHYHTQKIQNMGLIPSTTPNPPMITKTWGPYMWESIRLRPLVTKIMYVQRTNSWILPSFFCHDQLCKPKIKK